MGAYISTFPTGFAGLIPAALQKLLPGAQVVLLSARKREAEAAAQEMGFPLRQRYDTLVNGKKAAVYLLEAVSYTHLPFPQKQSAGSFLAPFFCAIILEKSF